MPEIELTPAPSGTAKLIALQPNQFHLTEEIVQQVTVWIPRGHNPEQLLDPTYWAHIARRLRTNAMITCLAEDGSFEVWLRVVSRDNTWAKCRLLFKWEAISEDEKAPLARNQLARIDYGGPRNKWRVLDQATGAVIYTGIDSRGDAEQRMNEYIEGLKQRIV